MKIRTVDFEILTKNYSKYQEGLQEIENKKNEFIKRLEPLKNEMERIITTSSNLTLDNNLQQERVARFEKLKAEAMEIDSESREVLSSMKQELNSNTYDELEVIIGEWGKKNEIDMIIGKMEVVYCNPISEITEDILNELQKKNLVIV
jgi:Skp family chaperone for outer membrane proteins